MLRGGISEPRNKNLFKMFNLIGIGEHAGSGVPDIFDVWENEGLKEPQVEEQFGVGVPDRTTLTLPLVTQRPVVSGDSPEKQPEKQPEKTDEMLLRSELVLKLIYEDATISRAKIVKSLEISQSQGRTVLDSMKSGGTIHREGSDKGGRWVID